MSRTDADLLGRLNAVVADPLVAWPVAKLASISSKKVKVGANWNLYPAVVEPNGNLRDKVRVRCKVGVNLERYYYIDIWMV